MKRNNELIQLRKRAEMLAALISASTTEDEQLYPNRAEYELRMAPSKSLAPDEETFLRTLIHSLEKRLEMRGKYTTLTSALTAHADATKARE